MGIKNLKLGGTDWVDGEKVNSVDINDTFAECTPYKNNKYPYSLAPIGSIVAYHFDYAFSNKSIPAGWVACNGQTISDITSVYNGQTAPALNGTTEENSLFLRGNTTSGGTGGVSTHGHGWVTRNSDNSNYFKYFEIFPVGAYNIPKYLAIKWIMRIK